MSLCLAAAGLVAQWAVTSFTLAWTHSIEKQRWEEDWRVVGTQLHLEQARIRGTGAGMEPPADARLAGGIWHYRPRLPAQDRVRLTHSRYAGSYTLCSQAHCQALEAWLPGLSLPATDGVVVELFACAAPSTRDAP